MTLHGIPAFLALAAACLALSGCSAALSGRQTTGDGTTASATSVGTRGQVGSHSVKASASFGTPPPPGAAGGQLSLSRGAAAVLVVGLLVAEVVNYFMPGSDGHAQSALDPRRPIAGTCSCYGYRAESHLTSVAPAE